MDAIAAMADALRRHGVSAEIIRAAAVEARAACQPTQTPPPPARILRRQSRWVGSAERERWEDQADQARQRRGSVAVNIR